MDGTFCNPRSRKLLEEFIDETEPCLLIGTPSRDSFNTIQSSDPHMKELMPLREGLHVTTQWYLRQLDACRRSASWRESARRNFMEGPICRWNVQKMWSESSEYVWNTTGAFINSWRIKTALERYFEKRAHEIGEINSRKTTLWNMCNPMLMETILKVLREQFKEDDQLNAAGRLQAQYKKPCWRVNKS